MMKYLTLSLSLTLLSGCATIHDRYCDNPEAYHLAAMTAARFALMYQGVPEQLADKVYNVPSPIKCDE